MSINDETLEKYIKILADNYQLKINDDYQDRRIEDAMTVISNEKKNPKLISNLLEQFRPTQILPETIGSFLFGCLQQTYGDVPVECSPLCAYGIKDDGNLEVKRCQNQIYVQFSNKIGNRFHKLNDSQSRQGYLFVYIDFMGFTHEEKNFFKNNGILKLHILLTHNSKHHTIIKMKDIDSLPMIFEYEGNNYAIIDNRDQSFEIDNETENDNVYMYIIISVAVMIIIATIYNRN